MKSSILKELQRIELAIRGIDPLADIAELEQAQSDMQALIVALQATDTSHQAQISGNDSDISALQAADTSLQSQISGNDSDISALQAADTSLQSQISGNDSDISALQAADTSLQSQISGNDSDISALQAADTSLQSQISGNDSDISGHSSRISTLEAMGGGGATGLSMAVLSDVKPAQTGGGTATAGAWRTRDLNTITDPDSIITSLSGNQFVLPAGDYIIIASAPAYKVAYHQIRLQDISSNTTALLGTTEYSGTGGYYASTRSAILGFVTPATNTTFEIQHLVYSTFALVGFGGGYSWAVAQNSVYTQALVIKL